jgi:hypothetical protein
MQQLDHRIHLIYLDGVLKIINIQKILHYEILFIIQVLSSVTKDVTTIKGLWKDFNEKLKQSIQNHLRLIEDAARSNDYGRYSLLANVEILEFDLIKLRNSENFIDRLGTREKCEDIKRNIKDISNSPTYTNADGGLRNNILNRLEKLWNNCDDVIDAC